MNLKNFLEDCRQENIIDQSTMDRMYAHFLAGDKQRSINAQQQSQLNKSNGLIITVSIIGVLLIGFGIIYLFAHNWDNLSRSTKTVLSLLPVFISVLVNVFTLVKRKDNVIWQESGAIFSFLATGSMLALIMQIYQLPGIENYFFTYWCVLCLPIVYLNKSHSAVFCAMILMLLNLTSNPMDQSALYKIPWFGSLMMFSTLIPYFKRLFTTREPSSLYTLHQLFVPVVVCLSAIASINGPHASIWLILFLVLANFHLFGSSIFLRTTNRYPTVMSIIGYVGVSLTLTYLLFNKKWGFEKILEVDTHDYRLLFIPLLFGLGIFQLVRYFSKEKMTIHHLYKWIILFPVPFILMDYLGMNAFPSYQISLLLVTFLVVHLAQNRKDEWQIYPTLGILSMIILSLSYEVSGPLSFFLLSLIPSLYYLAPIPLLQEKSKNTLSADHIIILCFQFLFLLIASFGGFWMAVKTSVKPVGHFELSLIGLICLAMIINTIKVRAQLMDHLNGFPAIFSLLVPALIWIGCVSSVNLEHLFSILLLFTGIIMLIFSAKKSNLTVANLSLGLIGLVMTCRFFDLKMSLTVKGILFILIGSSFFFANYLILKSRKHENKN
ncbi:MAG: hypothetical protein A3D31_19200 [Candidatus Fluviicola riflensis]|nr:MAG: hypothetical protein CHH17_05925 [Candidatus Fluviicola riflensis]OGS75915.1 MAG: hypothetical protein A3D31_19200 [Candidatus Fluviicola riflensis]OGS83595.1 MAG: hypothetical protein A2724_19215 [Fluviicola sp. RIFCSPHIGHO2_01_FULL_43_53]OGS85734.1 MAG: hypothetical protein A3E30_18745 [Fluviicola sp. RIFCSPHIGHO2_12_FULL_43_24]